MRYVFWIFICLILTGVALLIVVGPWVPKNSLSLFLVLAFFGATNLGSFWMIFMAIRHEKHPLAFIFLALLPYAFVWYYFDRVRPKKHRTRLRENSAD